MGKGKPVTEAEKRTVRESNYHYQYIYSSIHSPIYINAMKFIFPEEATRGERERERDTSGPFLSIFSRKGREGKRKPRFVEEDNTTRIAF